jgi:polysaccharide export outer membrane protein
MPDQETGSEVFRATIRDLESGALSQNIELHDGDTIFVPRAETVYVFGQVKNPGAYGVQMNTTVLQALSLAGGVTEHGAMNRIKVIRIAKGSKKELKVKLTDTVRPGDTIIVPQRYF